jgi:integrase
LITKTDNGWLVDSQPGGRGAKRFRKTFKTQAEAKAKAYEAWLKTQINQNSKWQPEKRDTRKLSELVKVWFDQHGSGLKDGINRMTSMVRTSYALGDPVADKFNTEMFASYRTTRVDKGIGFNTVNHEHAYLSSMFNELIRLGAWKRENPLAKLRKFKIDQTELGFLTLDDIETLFASLASSRNVHVVLIAKICLSTGARWSEAEQLQITQVKQEVIEFARTKSGKVRGVPIDAALENEIRKHHKTHGQIVRIFGTAAAAFREGVERAGLVLPDGQLTHVLRHSFATHYIMGDGKRGGNILDLQRLLGHADLKMTMRYAHRAPEHLQDAKTFNPITRLTLR